MEDERILKGQLFQYLMMIGKADSRAQEESIARWNSIGKPIGGLGLLEKGITKIAGARGSAKLSFDRKAVVVFCADHGVVAEGVSQTGSNVTQIVASNMEKGSSSVCLMAEKINADVYPVDIGMLGPHAENKELIPGRICDRKIAQGTENMVSDPAMSQEQCVRAILTGIDIAMELEEKGYDVIGLGEMGIGNTTPSSAIVSVLLNLPADEVTGRGAGLSDEGLKKKIEAIEKAIARYWEAAQAHPIPDGPFFQAEAGIKLLAHLGGYEIAGMLGVILGGAVAGIPVMLDGFITEAAALLAFLFKAESMQWVLASHVTAEPAGRKVLKYLHLDPVIDAGLCLGEGTGAVMAMGLYDMAFEIYNRMESFDEIGVKAYDPADKH